MPKSNTSGKGYFCIISALLIWSSQGIVIRAAKMPVVSLIFYSLMVSLLIQSFIFLRASKGLPTARGLLHIFVLSVLSLINTLTYYYAFSYTSISNAVFTHYIAPVVVMVLAPIFLKERVTMAAVFSVATASFGLWIIMRDVSVLDVAAQIFSSGPNFFTGQRFKPDTIGIICGLTSGVAYGAIIIVLKIISVRNNKYAVVFFQNLFVVMLLMPFAGPAPSIAESLWIVVGMGVLYSTAATYLYYGGIAHVGANKAAILGYIEPIGAIFFGALVLSELPDMLSLLGGLLIIAAGYIVIKKG
ncbi:MAG: DMT family transporter [Nitrospirae bacterium]|nr:DMT family transporter [Nitrospirota bacterium]